MISLTQASLHFRVHENITIFVFNSYAPRGVFCFLMAICIDSFNCAVWVLPSLELSGM